MRISDWSSDVCSSDLGHSGDRVAGDEGTNITDSEDALTYLLEQSPVRSVLDQQRVGVIGHSLGAITTLGLQAVEPRLQAAGAAAPISEQSRSEEHTSELQSLMSISSAVFCLRKK